MEAIEVQNDLANYCVFVLLYYYVRNDVHIIIARDKEYSPENSLLKFIGGKGEDFEKVDNDDNRSFKATAVREVEEETELKIEADKLHLLSKDPIAGFQPHTKVFYVYRISAEEVQQIAKETKEIYVDTMKVEDLLKNPRRVLKAHYTAAKKAHDELRFV